MSPSDNGRNPVGIYSPLHRSLSALPDFKPPSQVHSANLPSPYSHRLRFSLHFGHAYSSCSLVYSFSVSKYTLTENRCQIFFERKQITGIEPASPAWEASVLPMNYICISTQRKTSFFAHGLSPFAFSVQRKTSFFAHGLSPFAFPVQRKTSFFAHGLSPYVIRKKPVSLCASTTQAGFFLITHSSLLTWTL